MRQQTPQDIYNALKDGTYTKRQVYNRLTYISTLEDTEEESKVLRAGLNLYLAYQRLANKN